MVLTRSKANSQGTAPLAPPTTPAKKAPTKRKNNTPATQAAKVTKADATQDVTAAKEVKLTEENLTNSTADKKPEAEAAVPETTATAIEVSESTKNLTPPPAPTAPASSTILAPVDVAGVTAVEPHVVSTEEPTAHKDAITSSGTLQPYDVVVSDIEGTTTPIVFVKENLFPYVTSKLPEFLKANWSSEEMKPFIDGLRDQAALDVKDGLENAILIATESAEVSAEKVQEDVIASIGWQMKADRKIGALKAFQGFMWKEGYTSGDLKGAMYDDVIPAFDKWKAEGKKLYIYSSGSIAAQKLLFGFSENGDILHYFSGHYDTTIGQKVEAESYKKIADDIGISPSRILFLSDNIHEIVAAKKAGLQAVVTDRPGNAPLTAEERADNIVVKSFLEILNAQ
ncbi:hypothetical protein BG011_001136 [Mortierella polycephala]|uniref:Enolase-phosphatase E1 n=1 Tax=Mortierella polycephala TaxID=41804 RepID=A0A9P6PH88_9FUNG|nr:hypothetical protein BG011_001136 [Mortierella polycephala]